jgi:hypothetical protein
MTVLAQLEQSSACLCNPVRASTAQHMASPADCFGASVALNYGKACLGCDAQVVIALLGSDLIYFELNPNGQLLEVEKKENLADISCLTIAKVPEGRQRSSVVVAGCSDNTVRVLSLEPSDCLMVKATQTTASPPVSVMLMEAHISAAGTCKLSLSNALLGLVLCTLVVFHAHLWFT